MGLRQALPTPTQELPDPISGLPIPTWDLTDAAQDLPALTQYPMAPGRVLGISHIGSADPHIGDDESYTRSGASKHLRLIRCAIITRSPAPKDPDNASRIRPH
jgi:hypothetical protein